MKTAIMWRSKRQEDDGSMDEDRVLFETQWVRVKQSPRGFQYLERQGKDSVAVFLVRRGAAGYEVLIRWQPLCIDNRVVDGGLRLFPCPITGGMNAGERPEAAAVREVYEEAGYRVEVVPLGKYGVGTQTNEVCFLFYADVTGKVPGVAPQDGSYHESISRNAWHPFEFLEACEYVACQIGYFRLKSVLAELG